jgi:hypothetical protein
MGNSLASSLAAPVLLALLTMPARAQLPEWRPYGNGSCELIANHWQSVGDLWTTVEQCRGGSRQQRLAISCSRGQIARETEVARNWSAWRYAHGADLALLRDWCPQLLARAGSAGGVAATTVPAGAASPNTDSAQIVAERTRRAAETQRVLLGLP